MNTKQIKSRTIVVNAVLITATAACIALLIYRIHVTSRTLYNSDAATLSVYAHAILASHSLFPPGWQYNNGDVWLYNALIFIVPLITIFPNGYGVYAAATSLYSCLILFGVYWGVRQLRVSQRAALLLVAIMASGIASPFLADLLYDWGANYGSEFFIAFLELIAFVKIMRWRPEEGRGRLISSASLMSAMILVGAASNSSRALIYQCAPFVLGLPVLWLIERRSSRAQGVPNRLSSSRYWAVGATVFLFFVAGSLVNHRIAGNFAGLNAPRVYQINDLPQHLGMICVSIFFMLGGPATTWANLLGDVSQISLLSVAGFWLSVRIVIALFLVWVGYFFVRHVVASKKLSAELHVYSIIAGVSLALIFFLHVFTFRYPPNDYESARYVFGPLMIAFIGVFGYFSAGIGEWIQSVRVTSLVGCSLVLLSYMNHVYPRFFGHPWGTIEFARTDKDSIVSCLKSAGLRHGYASLWLSHVMTIMSDSKIIVRPVLAVTDPRALVREPMHSIPRWYEPGTWNGPTFLMLDDWDLSTMPSTWEAMFGKPTRRLMCGTNHNPNEPGPVHVFVYSYNIGPKFN